MARVLAGLAAVSVLAAIVVALLLLTGVVGGSSDDPGTADEIAQKVAAAIRQPGMVYSTLGSDGSVTWIDEDNKMYRRQDAPENGGLTSVGHGWTVITYDVQNNGVREEDNTPNGSQAPRIDDPAVRWTNPLAAIAFSNQLTVIGRSVADGQEVIVLEANTPVVDSSGNATGALFGRVEVDAKTYLPYSYQRRETRLDGSTATPAIQGVDPNERITYTTRFVPTDSLAADFFDRSIVEQQVKTNAKAMQQIRKNGLTPLWFGQIYDGGADHQIALPPTISVYTTVDPLEADIHYALVGASGPSTNAVIVRLAADATRFTHPTITQFAGDLPEEKETVSIGDASGTLYSSILTVDTLPCPSANCPQSSARLYRRLVFQHGDTAVQIEVSPRVRADGSDSNGFNSREGIIELAGALTDVPADIASATPTPAP